MGLEVSKKRALRADCAIFGSEKSDSKVAHGARKSGTFEPKRALKAASILARRSTPKTSKSGL